MRLTKKGHTLPPFTPSHHPPRAISGHDPGPYIVDQHARENLTLNSKQRVANAQVAANVHEGRPAGSDRSAPRQDPYSLFLSGNSWATQSQTNSFNASNPPISALLPPKWPGHSNTNSVPSPPFSQNDYQRPSPLSAGLAHLDLTLHHHIDTIFHALSRLITDKHDHILDRVLIRLEDIEEASKRGLKDVRGELKSTKTELLQMKASISEQAQNNANISPTLDGLGNKLASLEAKIDQSMRQGWHDGTSRSPTRSYRDHTQRMNGHRRTESADGVLDRGEGDNPFTADSTYPIATQAQARGHRSNTSRSQPDISSPNDMRELLSRLGAGTGRNPDLRDHPAFAGMRGRSQNRAEEPYRLSKGNLPEYASQGSQPLEDGGWYHQAYGRR